MSAHEACHGRHPVRDIPRLGRSAHRFGKVVGIDPVLRVPAHLLCQEPRVHVCLQGGVGSGIGEPLLLGLLGQDQLYVRIVVIERDDIAGLARGMHPARRDQSGEQDRRDQHHRDHRQDDGEGLDAFFRGRLTVLCLILRRIWRLLPRAVGRVVDRRRHLYAALCGLLLHPRNRLALCCRSDICGRSADRFAAVRAEFRRCFDLPAAVGADRRGGSRFFFCCARFAHRHAAGGTEF